MNTMQTEDGLHLQEVLRASESALRNVVSTVPEERAKVRSQPECWSVVEIIEHVAIVDELFSKRILHAQSTPEMIRNPEREVFITTNIPLREQLISAPPAAHPQGIFATTSDALERFSKVRVRVSEILKEKEQNLRFLEVTHPVLGRISGYEAFLLLAAHTNRHVTQILELHKSAEI